MNLGFYYHIPATQKEGRIYLPGYLGLFLDTLAGFVPQLTLFLHEANDTETAHCDYQLQANNIVWVNMGIKTPAWHRFLFGRVLLRKYIAAIKNCDVVLVRAPSPLSPSFYTVFRKTTNIVFLLVGDYVAGIEHLELLTVRKWAIRFMAVRLDRTLKKAALECCIIANSQLVFEQFRPYAKSLHSVRTTTLRHTDFFRRKDTCTDAVCNLLFVGRYDFSKGVRELLDATHQLIQQGRAVHLHVAGWEDDPTQPVATWLEMQAKTLGITHAYTNHGKKQSGESLNALYRSADIFVLPSYNEGFPRTIWEAMANSVPVIASKVGSIPFYLKDGENALLIPAQDVPAIVEKVVLVLNNASKRQEIIANGYALAEENTLAIQTEKLWKIIEKDTALKANGSKKPAP